MSYLGPLGPMDLDLDNYVAEPFSIYAMGESWECLFSPEGGAVFLKPFTVSARTTLSSRWFQFLERMLLFWEINSKKNAKMRY